MKTYPKEVEDYSNELVRICIENHRECQDPNESELKYEKYLLPVIKDMSLQNFLDGNESINLTDDQFNSAWKIALANQSIDKLKKYGLVDIIEDENGEEIIFLTKKGKELGETLK